MRPRAPFTDNEIVARARENDRNAHFDTELVAQIAEQGYLAIVPQESAAPGWTTSPTG